MNYDLLYATIGVVSMWTGITATNVWSNVGSADKTLLVLVGIVGTATIYTLLS